MVIYHVNENSIVEYNKKSTYEDEYGRYQEQNNLVKSSPKKSDYGYYVVDSSFSPATKVLRLTPSFKFLQEYKYDHTIQGIIEAEIVGEIGLGFTKLNVPVRDVFHVTELDVLDVFSFEFDYDQFKKEDKYVFLEFDKYHLFFCDESKRKHYVEYFDKNCFLKKSGDLELKIR